MDRKIHLTDERFEEFWSAYPRKVGKAAAYKAWKRIHPDTALFNRMLTAVNAASQTDQWQREAGRFVPNPLTWLNQGRWDDDYSPANQPSRPEAKGNGNALTRLMAKMEAEEAARSNEIRVDEP